MKSCFFSSKIGKNSCTKFLLMSKMMVCRKGRKMKNQYCSFSIAAAPMQLDPKIQLGSLPKTNTAYTPWCKHGSGPLPLQESVCRPESGWTWKPALPSWETGLPPHQTTCTSCRPEVVQVGQIVGRGTFIPDNYNSLMVVRKSCRQELPRPAREVYISLIGIQSQLIVNALVL